MSNNINLEKLEAAAIAETMRAARRRNDWAEVDRVVQALDAQTYKGDADRILDALARDPKSKRAIIEKADNIQAAEIRSEIKGLAGAILDTFEEGQILAADNWDDLPGIWQEMQETISGSSLTFNRTAAKRVARYIPAGDYLEDTGDLEGELACGNFTGLAQSILYDAVQPHLTELFEERKERLTEEQENQAR